MQVSRLLHVHVRRLSDIMFNPPFVYQHVASLTKSMRLTECKVEEARLCSIERTSLLSEVPKFHQHVMHDSTTAVCL